VTKNNLGVLDKCHKIVSHKKHDMAMKLKVQLQTLQLGQKISSITMDDLYYDVEPQFAITFVTTFGIVSINGWLGFNHVII